MGLIRNMARLQHSQLDGTDVYKMDDIAKTGVPQEVLVVCKPRAVINPHTHAVDAEMFIVGGSARVLSDDPSLNGQTVTAGEVVFFEKDVPHGFEALDSGLVFVSRNGGIVDEEAQWDMNFNLPQSVAS